MALSSTLDRGRRTGTRTELNGFKDEAGVHFNVNTNHLIAVDSR